MHRHNRTRYEHVTKCLPGTKHMPHPKQTLPTTTPCDVHAKWLESPYTAALYLYAFIFHSRSLFISFLLLHFSYIFIYNLRKNPHNGWTRRERASSRSYSLCAFMAFQAYCGPEAKVRRNHIFFLSRASGFCFVCVNNSFAISLVLHHRSLCLAVKKISPHFRLIKKQFLF